MRVRVIYVAIATSLCGGQAYPQESVLGDINALRDRTVAQEIILEKQRDEIQTIKERLAVIEAKKSTRRIAVRSLVSSQPGNNQQNNCDPDETVLACYALMVPSGFSLCNVSIISEGKSCSTSGCDLPAGQRYQLNTYCGKIVE